MEIQGTETFPAVADGQCDVCRGPFVAGDYVAQPHGDEVLCPACVLELLLLESS